MALVASVKNKHVPSNWSYMSSGTQVQLVELSRSSAEYSSVISKTKVKSGTGKFEKEISKIVRVQNPYLWGSYLLKKEECKARSGSVTEKHLFHVTSQYNIDSITKDNLDWRRASRTRFGQGVSFSPYADYADYHCNSGIGSSRALIVARVLKGLSIAGRYETTLPRAPFDTTHSNGDRVFVKYYDNEFYPEYIVYYTGAPDHHLRLYDYFDDYDHDYDDFDVGYDS